MKRLLILLLLLVLPVCSLAETYEASIKVKTEDEIFAVYAKELLQKIPGLSAENEDKYVQVLRAVLRDAEMKAVAQDDAVSLEFSLAGGSLFDMVVREIDTALYLTSSLIPGYALVEEMNGMHFPFQNKEGLAEDPTLQRNADSIEIAISNLLVGIEPTTVHGAFRGDAFEDGTWCTTWMFSDKDIAAWLSAFMTDDVRSLLAQMMPALELNASDLLSKIDEINDRVADEDKYSYILRVVRDDADQFVGLSITVTEDVSQLATISFGMTDEGVRTVIGLGMDVQNYWWEYTVQTSTREHLTFIKGSSREWVADKGESFTYVSKTNAPVSIYTWNCNMTKSGQRYLWDGTLYTGDATDVSQIVCTYRGSVNLASSAFETSISMMKTSRTAFTLEISYKPVEPISAMDDEILTQCFLNDPTQTELYNELNSCFSMEMTSRILKLLPLEVIFTLDEMLMDY